MEKDVETWKAVFLFCWTDLKVNIFFLSQFFQTLSYLTRFLLRCTLGPLDANR